VDTLFVRDSHREDDPEQQAELLRYGKHNIQGSDGIAFVDVVRDMLGESGVIETSRLSIPHAQFHARMHELLGKDLLQLSWQEQDAIQFVVMGVHTDVRVWGTANMLRNQYGFSRVYVCPHLMASPDAHAQGEALKWGFSHALVQVVPGLSDLMDIVGLPSRDLRHLSRFAACRIAPAAVEKQLSADQQAIIRQLFLGFSHVELKPLGGGYSGGLLMLGKGETGSGAHGKPVVVKLDRYLQMQREISGYHRITDLLGNHAPAFSASVTYGEWTGIRMDLASKQGAPRSLQQIYVSVRSPVDSDAFERGLAQALDTLVERLYANTLRSRKAYIYRELALHSKQQRQWLHDNISNIVGQYPAETLALHADVHLPDPLPGFRRISSHNDRVDIDCCLCHGDLNLQNILLDGLGNHWFIDWPFAGEKPLETDFAKLENDIKFVLCKDLSETDLPQLLQMESFLSERVALPPLDGLPESVALIGRDSRLRRIYSAVRQLRQRYLGIRTRENDSLYRIALLRYAVHTLSFDQRSGRGECHLSQLKYALLSTCLLIKALEQDPMHQWRMKEHPDDYPRTPAIPLEKLDWQQPYPDYAPVAVGRPCPSSHTQKNPQGRTGYSGLGFFLQAGENRCADAIVTRVNPASEKLELLLGKDRQTGQYGLIGTFMGADSDPRQTAARACRQKLGLALDFSHARVGERMPMRDYRQTDDAYVTSRGVHLHLHGAAATAQCLQIPQRYDDVGWMLIISGVYGNLFASHADLLREALLRLEAEAIPQIPMASIQECLALMEG
jgi:hypothetical protein